MECGTCFWALLVTAIIAAVCSENATVSPKRSGVIAYGPPNATFLPALETYLRHGEDGEDGYHYDETVRPNLFAPLDIDMQFYLSGIGSVDEKLGIIQPHGILIMQWTDRRLTWDPQNFGNITAPMIEGYKIWIPRFFHNGVYYVPEANGLLSTTIHYTGIVTVMAIIHEQTPCRFDMTDFPRDTQKCFIQLLHADAQVKLHPRGAGMLGKTNEDVERQHHVAWEILNVTLDERTELAGVKMDYLTISISMKRHASFFLRIYVTPVCFLLLLIPIIFLLPPDSPEKLTYGAVLLFCMIFVSQSVESIYPPYTDSVPYLIRLTTASGALLFLCIMLTSLITSFERIGRKRAVPPLIKRYIIGVVGPFLLVKENTDALSHGTVHIKPAGDNDTSYIVQSEQSVDISNEHIGNGASENNSTLDINHTLQSLVNELKQSRLQHRAQDDWTNLFTIINRFLFLLTLLIGIIIILCFA